MENSHSSCESFPDSLFQLLVCLLILFWRAEEFELSKVQLIAVSKTCHHVQGHPACMLFSINFIVLHFTLRPMVHFELIFYKT